jgi:hypothetical protein
MATHYMQARTLSGVSINWLAVYVVRGVTVVEAGLDFTETQPLRER